MPHRPLAPVAVDRAARWTTRRFLLAILAIWLAAAAVTCIARAHAIATHSFVDVDDELRLVEVRDWLGGQSFWDVSQHRMNQPAGAPMHWSRIVDAPIAATEIALRPIAGPDGAQWAAAAIVPMATLLAAMLLIALTGRRMGGLDTGFLAAATAPGAVAMTLQIQPLRVDHHGWEIVCALAALAASLSDRRRHAGALAGAAIAIGLQISLELLPFALALGGVIAARWLIDPSPREARRLSGYAAALPIVEGALFLALHRPAEWATVYCDAVSPPHLAALAVVGAGVPACCLLRPRTLALRAAALAAVAIVAILAFRAVPPACGLDPFSALGPLERRYWLANVLEGRPVWLAGPALAIAVTGFPLLGLGCAILVAWRETGAARVRWIAYAAMLAAATAIGILVLRASSLANAMALVPVFTVATRLLVPVRASGSAFVRVFGTAAILVLLGPWGPAFAATLLPQPSSHETDKGDPAPCRSTADLSALDRLPPARILAPIDVGPTILLYTHHAVLASGHHRNHVAMADEIAAMIGGEAVAEHVVRAHGMAYVLACPELNEQSIYAKAAPHGFAPRLAANDAPRWLERVRVPGSRLRLWRVLPAQPPAGLPSSRSAGGSVPAAAQISRSAAFSPSS